MQKPLRTKERSSDSSVYGRRCFALNAAWLAGGSEEMPITSQPASVNASYESRKEQASLVQPGVSSFG